MQQPTMTGTPPEVDQDHLAALEAQVAAQRDAPTDAALAQARELVALAARHGDPLRQARALQLLGTLLTGRAEFSDALRAQTEADACIARVGGALARSESAAALGRIYLQAGDLDGALDQYERARQLLGTEEAPLWLAKLIGNLSIVYRRLGETALAVRYAEQSRDRIRGHGGTADQARAENTLGLAYRDAPGRDDEAARCFEAAIALTRAQGPHSTAAAALINLAEVLILRNRLAEARMLCDEALEISRRHGLAAIAMQAVAGQGKIALAEGSLAAAIAHFDESIRMAPVADSTGIAPHVVEAHQGLAAAHEAAGDLARALAHYKRYLALELKSRDVQAQIAARAITTREELEAARSELSSTRKVAEIEHQRNLELAGTLTRLRDEVGKLDREAREDPLTAIGNRRYLELRLDELRLEAGLGGTALSVLMIDIDHFKAINDRFSHATGDAVLQRVAQLLTEQCRGPDLIARFGGEEFVVALPGLAIAEALRVAERICRAIECNAWQTLANGLAVTVSIGVDNDLSQPDNRRFLAAADSQLYRAKRAGRNRVMSRLSV